MTLHTVPASSQAASVAAAGFGPAFRVMEDDRPAHAPAIVRTPELPEPACLNILAARRRRRARLEARR